MLPPCPLSLSKCTEEIQRKGTQGIWCLTENPVLDASPDSMSCKRDVCFVQLAHVSEFTPRCVISNGTLQVLLLSARALQNFWPGPSADMCRGFLLYKFWRILPGNFPGGFFWAFSHKNEEKKSGDKIRDKIRRLKNINPRKIRSAKIRP